jgi:hypothetical protein
MIPIGAFRFVAAVLAGWANQRQQDALEYLREENRFSANSSGIGEFGSLTE